MEALEHYIKHRFQIFHYLLRCVADVIAKILGKIKEHVAFDNNEGLLVARRRVTVY